MSDLNDEHFNSHWDQITGLYAKALRWLHKNRYIISQSWMPYENMLVPLIILGRELPGNDYSQMTEEQRVFVRFWYWSSIFAQRYSASSNETIIQDSNSLQRLAQTGRISDRTFLARVKPRITSHEDIYSIIRKQTAAYKGLLNLINFENEIDSWTNGSIPVFNDSKIEAHHIFPVKHLRANYRDGSDERDLVDCVANRTLIPKITNIKIGGKAPWSYLQELKKSNPQIAESLRRHKIPEGLLVEDFYKGEYLAFLEERAKILFSLIEKYTIQPRDHIQKKYTPAGTDSSAKEIQLPPLNDDYSGKKLTSIHFKSNRFEVRHWREALRWLLCRMYEGQPDKFREKAITIKGTQRPYICSDKSKLRVPGLISDASSMYFESNLNANTASRLMRALVIALGHQESDLIFNFDDPT